MKESDRESRESKMLFEANVIKSSKLLESYRLEEKNVSRTKTNIDKAG